MKIRYFTLYLGLLLFTLPYGVFGQSETHSHSLGETIKITTNNYPYVEPHAAVNPEDPSNIVVGAMALPEKNMGIKTEVFYTLDGGKSWNNSILPKTPVAGDDPQIAFGEGDTVYLVTLPGIMFISTDKGQTFKKSLSIPSQSSTSDSLTGSYDYPKILSDAESGEVFIASGQSIRISEQDSYSTGSVNMIRYDATDSTFSGPVRNTHGYIQLKAGNPVFTADKNILFPVSEITKYGFRQILDSPRLWIARSTDMGATLEPLRFVRENHMASIPTLASYTSKEDTNMVVASYANFEPDDFNLYSLISEDGGMSWSSPNRINDDTAHTHTKRPESVFNDNGILAHFWMDSRDDSTGECFTPYFAYSNDYGSNYSNVPLYNKPVCNKTEGNLVLSGNPQRPEYTIYDRWKRGGDYFGFISLPNNTFMAIWSDSRDGTYQLYSRSVIIKRN